MRTPQEVQQFSDAFRSYLGRDPDPGALAAFHNSNIGIGDRVQQIQTSPEYAQRQASLAFQPQVDSLNTQIGQLQNNAQQANLQSGAQASGLQASIDQAIQGVNRNATNDRSQMLADQSNLGLVGSGNTDAGLQASRFNTTSTLNNLETQRANQLASLALSNANNQSSLADSIKQAQGQKAQLQNQQGQAGYNQAYQNNNEFFNQNLQKAQLSQLLPSGVNIPFGQNNITGTGTQGADKLVSLFQNPFLIKNLPDDVLKSILQSYGHTVTP